VAIVLAIKTKRLVLRGLDVSDAARLSLLAGDYDIASMTATIPHPYSEQQAAEWIDSVKVGDEGVVFGIEREGLLIGCTGYRAFGDDHAELGYWIGKPYWGQGYASEAVAALIGQAFDANAFDYVTAGHFADNGASERVLQKLGFVAQGTEERDCLARGDTAKCVTYRLDRVLAAALSPQA